MLIRTVSRRALPERLEVSIDPDLNQEKRSGDGLPGEEPEIAYDFVVLKGVVGMGLKAQSCV